MSQPITRRTLLAGSAALGAAVALPGVASAGGGLAKVRQLAFLNHSYAVLDRPTADAVENSAFLRDFGTFQVRTTSTGGSGTYTGRYLLGEQTYLEMFGPGDLPGADGLRGATGLALSPDHAGRIASIKQRMIALGATAPLDAIQTKKIGAASIDWFRVVAPSTTYVASFSWVMEYLQSYFDDPRTDSAPAAYAGDVSRRRYNAPLYDPAKPFRNVVGVELAVPADDRAAVVIDLRSAGLRVEEHDDRVVGRGRSETITVRTVDRARAGWRRIELALNHRVRRHVERIGNSTFTAGPGARATWCFDVP